MHPEVPPPPTSDSAAIALQIAIEARLKLLYSSQIANVRRDVERTRPILDSGIEANIINMEVDHDDIDGNDKTVSAARDYQVRSSSYIKGNLSYALISFRGPVTELLCVLSDSLEPVLYL